MSKQSVSPIRNESKDSQKKTTRRVTRAWYTKLMQ